eukprot:SAG31_NODE_9978_length_1202_cov_0.938350_2_plen_161_part_00
MLAAAEARMCIAHADTAGLDMSEQELVECVYAHKTAEEKPEGGCGGGSVKKGWDYIAAGGLTAEADRPYTGIDDRDNHGSCGTNPRAMAAQCPTHQSIASNVRSIMYAIETGGPVSASMTCATSFMIYDGGVYQKVDEGGGGHAVTLLGWGTSETGIPCE